MAGSASRSSGAGNPDRREADLLARIASAESEARVWREMAQSLLTRLEKLVDDLVTLKREGFVPPPVTGSVEVEGVPEVLQDAIDQRAPAGSDLARSLRSFARMGMRAGRSPEEMAEEILRGEPVEQLES